VGTRKNLLMQINSQYRFIPFYPETKRLLLGGEFGRVVYIQCRQQMFHPPETAATWRGQLKQYVLFEFGTHALASVLFFSDALPQSVNAPRPRGQHEDDADTLVRMSIRVPEQSRAAFSFNRVSHVPSENDAYNGAGFGWRVIRKLHAKSIIISQY